MGIEQSHWLLRKKVLPQHTDHAGVMWHGSYVNWLEEARVKALDDVGIAYSDLSFDGLEMPVIGLNIKYIVPLMLGDEVILKSTFKHKKNIRLQWETSFINIQGKISAEADVVLTLVRREKTSIRIMRQCPSYIEDALHKLLKGPCL